MTNEAGITKALAAIITAAGCGDWIVGGSAGLLLRGLKLPAEPRDLDLYCDETDMRKLHDRLQKYAIDDPAYSETDIYRSWLSHYQIEGIRLELVGGFRVTAHGCSYRTEVKEALLPLGSPVSVDNRMADAVIVPLAHELWFNALRGRADRVQLIAEAFAASPAVHLEALRIIESRNEFNSCAISQVHRWIRNAEAGDEEWTLKSFSGQAAKLSV
ncbi:hypothetical protein RB620_02220 [Paenibacillus sp. LHD-117]|uniref:hypothetical protein n=1 Tax=Paenibacillus sp. LHD-117 TaxID=3071412 RepID=UPI0027DFE764|nr:hypothetical protein [Paenibacillus sp. LHD-117]MDQ6418244.1 hypothetical protein [Paenibacillus sp. LHD-117]